jgi:hypothetical protein
MKTKSRSRFMIKHISREVKGKWDYLMMWAGEPFKGG